MSSDLLRMIDELQREMREIKTQETTATLLVSTDNVSNPPTDAELDSAFDTAANLPDGYIALVDDAGAGTTVWLVVVSNNEWFYEGLTKAT